MPDPSEPAMDRTPDWWASHRISPEYREFVAREGTAARIELYHALCVPGILQVESYARAATAAIVKKEPADPGVLARVEIRMGRQRRLAERAAAGQPPRLVASMDEAVLRRPVGGPDVMREQLDRLLEVMVDEPWVTVVIVPLGLDGHPGLGGVFELLSFDGTEEPDVVFVESAAADFMLRNPDETRSYRETTAKLAELGLTGDGARAKIEELRGLW